MKKYLKVASVIVLTSVMTVPVVQAQQSTNANPNAQAPAGLTQGQINALKNGNPNMLRAILRARGIDLSQPIVAADVQAVLDDIFSEFVGDDQATGLVAQMATELLVASSPTGSDVTQATVNAASIVKAAATSAGASSADVDNGISLAIGVIAESAGVTPESLVAAVNSQTTVVATTAPTPITIVVGPPVILPPNVDDTEDDEASRSTQG